MIDTLMDDDTAPKPDIISRETSVGEGQVEQTYSSEDNTQNHSLGADDRPNANDRSPRGPAGYAHLADFMSKTQLGMVRKYKDLSLLNLLYLQAEIHQLRTDWEWQVAADARDTGTERSLWDYHWWAMANGQAKGLGGQRWEVWKKLRSRLYEYHQAIERHGRITALPAPNNAQRRFISAYIVDDDLNGGRGAFMSPELRGEDPDAYRERWREDLVLFEHGAESNDAFARWVVHPVLRAAHFCFLRWGKKPIHEDLEIGKPSSASEHEKQGPAAAAAPTPGPVVPLYQYNATGYTILNRVLNSLVVILLPCASIVSLNAVPDPNKRVGMVCAFSLVCAVGMALCSSASRIEVFAVTAAFMSVQLVFVGQQQQQGSQGH